MKRGRRSSDRQGIHVHAREKGFLCPEEDGVFEGLGKANCHGDTCWIMAARTKLFNIHTFNQDI